MANSGNDWNSFMQSKNAQVAMYGICVFFCIFYAVDGVLEMLSPERSANLIHMIGAPGYYAMTIIRCVVLLVTGLLFGRMMLKRLNEKDQ